jgi:excinuclease ABC subunit B
MYADTITAAMRAAIDETERRRSMQQAYNEEHGITPRTVDKAIRDTIRGGVDEEAVRRVVSAEAMSQMDTDDIRDVIVALEIEMRKAAEDLDFERAAELRDEIKELKASFVE